jgi:hypothetical protein
LRLIEYNTGSDSERQCLSIEFTITCGIIGAGTNLLYHLCRNIAAIAVQVVQEWRKSGK